MLTHYRLDRLFLYFHYESSSNMPIFQSKCSFVFLKIKQKKEKLCYISIVISTKTIHLYIQDLVRLCSWEFQNHMACCSTIRTWIIRNLIKYQSFSPQFLILQNIIQFWCCLMVMAILQQLSTIDRKRCWRFF